MRQNSSDLVYCCEWSNLTDVPRNLLVFGLRYSFIGCTLGSEWGKNGGLMNNDVDPYRYLDFGIPIKMAPVFDLEYLGKFFIRL